MREPIPVDPLTPDMLPEPLCAWIVDAAARLGASLDMAVIPMLVGLSTLLGMKLGIAPKSKDNWIVFSNLWGYVVAESGEKKSPAFNAALAPLRQIDDGEYAAFQSNAGPRQLMEKLRKAKLKGLEKKIMKAQDSGEPIDSLTSEYARLSQKETASPPRLYTNDATVEQMQVLLAASNDPTMMAEYDELSGLFLQMEIKGRAHERPFYLSGWDGDKGQNTDRIGRAAVRLSSYRLSIFGTMTPSSLVTFLLNPAIQAASSDGMMQRFQLAVYPNPAPLVRMKDADYYPDEVAEAAALKVYRGFYSYKAPVDLERTKKGVPFVRFTKAPASDV